MMWNRHHTSKNERKDRTVTLPQISLVTYTYNDTSLTRELIRHTVDFTIQPYEIIVVDDGSNTPFHMDDAPENLRIIRFERNQGIVKAKATGMSMASGEYLLSIDCDMRLRADWLERCLPVVKDQSVGMVGGAVENRSGDDLVSRYLHHFEDNHNHGHAGMVDFIPGNTFLMRQEVWDHSGGFLGHTDQIGEDDYLCSRLKRLGYQLYSDDSAKAWQLRQMSRTMLCQRMWRRGRVPTHRQALGAVKEHGMQGLMDWLSRSLVLPMLDRVARADRLKEPLFLYLELLHLVHGLLDTINHLEERGQVGALVRADLVASFGALFVETPRILTMLQADMNAMGDGVAFDQNMVQETPWKSLFSFIDRLRENGMLAYLETHGVPELIREEMDQVLDPSTRIRRAG